MESLNYSSGVAQPMRYWDAYRFIFTSPNGWMNLLMGAVCILIPVVGPIVLTGYLVGVMTSQQPNNSPGYPDFDFNRFMEYLTRGLWPFLVSMIVTLVVALPIGLIVGLGTMATIATRPHPVVLGLVIALAAILWIAMWVALLLVMKPVMIRAALLREFNGVFDSAWVKDFIRRMWREMLMSALFIIATSIPLTILGYAMCFIGMYPAITLLLFAQWHLYFQVYRIYLTRGGSPVEMKPPALPGQF